MIFTFFIAAVYASQSFRGISNSDPVLSINNDGKVEIEIMTGAGKYQIYDKDGAPVGEPTEVKTGEKGKVVADTADAFKLGYKIVEPTGDDVMKKVELVKAPNVSLAFVGQDGGVKPKLQIVKGDDFTGTEVVLNAAGTEKPITLTNGKSDEFDWTVFNKVTNKNGSIYVKENNKIDSVTKVIENASISLTRGTYNDEKMNISFTMTPGMITKTPTHWCIYYMVDGKITTESATFTPLTWAKDDASKQSFEYTYTDLSNAGDYFAVMTDSDKVTTDGKVSNITVPFKLDKTNPNNPVLSINNDGKVDIKIMAGPGKYQKYSSDTQTDGEVINVDANGVNGTVVANTTDVFKLWYKIVEPTGDNVMKKVELVKAPAVTLKFVGQDGGVKPKLQIVGEGGPTGTVLMLNASGTERSITLTKGESDEFDWTVFNKVPNKNGSIYIKKDGEINSVTKVIENASISLTKGTSTDEKMNLDFEMTPGMITAMPTHLCIYYKDGNGKITTESAEFTNMTWAKNDAGKQSFEYKYADLSNAGDYFAVMTDSNAITAGEVSNITEPFKLDKTKPSGAFSGVATIFAAIVSLLVFAL